MAPRTWVTVGRGRGVGRLPGAEGVATTVDPVRLLLEVAAFGTGLAALLASGRTVLGLVFAGLVVLHLGLTFALGQRPARPAS